MWQPIRTGLVLGSLTLSSTFLSAQSPLPPTSPSELIRGLREQGLSDLALEYIAENSTTWGADLKKEVSLERAKCRLELASTEVDDGNRDLQVATAKQELQEFLQANPTHPRAPEAAVSLARLLTLEGKGELQKAKRLTDDAEKKKVAEASRNKFDEASKKYGAAASGLERLLGDASLSDSRKRELTRDYYQALLDEAINYVLMGESYLKPVNKEIDERDKHTKMAQKLFTKLHEKDPSHPLGWVGRAWYAECFLILADRGSYDSEMKKVLEEGRRITAPAGAAAGVRMARFFQLRELFVKGDDPTSRLNTMTAARQWLADYPSAVPTPETFASMYYLGTVLLNEGLRRENLVIERGKPEKAGDPMPEKVVGVKPDGLTRLREADTFFRQIVAIDNDYKDRAMRQRSRAIRYLVGNADRPAEAFASFDELYMAALLQLDKAAGGGEPPASDADKQRAMTKAVEFLEATRKINVPRESARDAQQALMTLAQTYTSANRPHEGAILAESLCRSAKAPGTVAKMGATALFAYEKAGELIPGDNSDARTADRDRMIALANFVIQRAPNEAATNDIRLTQALLYSQQGAVKLMFDTLAKIPNNYSRLALVRLLQGVAAYEMVRARQADEPVAEPLNDLQKAEILKIALRDMSAVPPVTKATNKIEALDYFRLQVQLAQLHLTSPNGSVAAEKIVKETMEAVKAFPDLPGDEKTKLTLRCEGMRTRAVYARAMKPFIENKFKESADILAPMMADIVKAGPAVKPELMGDLAVIAKTLDADRIKLILVPLLNARLREGAVEQTTQLLDQLKTFGGNLLVTANVVQQGVASIRPTVETLRAEGKTDEANKLLAGIGTLVNKLATEKDLPNEVLLNLGRSFRDLGELGKAIELFERIPAPDNKGYLSGELKDPVIADTATPEERKKLETTHDANKQLGSVARQTKLELLRAYRATGDFAKADAILEEALGKEAPNASKILERNGGWAGKLFDYRREYHYLLEAKGNAAKDLKVAFPLFNQAMGLWKIRIDAYKAKLDGINKPMSALKQELDKLTNEGKSGEEIATVNQKIRAVEKEIEAVKPLWHDMIIERLKVLTSAYLFESKTKPDALPANMTKVANQIVQLEKNNTFNEANTTKLLEFINSNPALAKAYADAGGQLNKPKAPAAPAETPNK